ncbi:MAG: PIN domain-containing protein [Actinobacteria bacterium]|nr:MAG: PIN domain-containing protein [Actinomycetota bacterium]
MIVVDTGVLYAAADRSDPDHDESKELLGIHATEQLVATVSVVVETSWLISSRLGLTSDDWNRVVEFLEQDHDLDLGVVDASIVAVAERLNVTTIATLNDRDFRVVRPRHCDAFVLAP